MKKILLLLVLASISTPLFSQKIAENKIDEFTGHSVIRTSWEKFAVIDWTTSYFRFSKLDEHFQFDFKKMALRVFAIPEGEKLLFILDDGTVYKLWNLEHTISSKGAGAIGLGGSGAQGVSLTLISQEDPNFNKLISNPIVKVRLYTTDGYVESEVSEKDAKKIQTALNLINAN